MSKDKEKKKFRGPAKVAHIFRGLFLGAGIAALVGAVMGFAMNGFINLYYSDPANLEQAAGSLDADMGIFAKIMPFDALKAGGQYGIYFGLQLVCAAISCAILVYIFIMLRTVLVNIQEKGAAFGVEEEKKYRITFIILSLLVAAMTESMIAGVVSGLLFCGVFMLTKRAYGGYDTAEVSEEKPAGEEQAE